MSITKVVFIHGGPGLNSNPEKNLLKAKFKDNNFEVIFWNEPQTFIGNNYYNEIIHSIKSEILKHESIVILAHSFGARMALDALPGLESRVKSVFFLSPCIDIINIDKKIIEFSLSILKKNNTENYQKLLELLPLKSNDFDENRENAILYSFSSNYIVHNFNSIESFERYFEYLQDEYSFQIEDYLKIRRTVPSEIKISKKIDIAVTTIYGKNDPIINPIESDKEILKYFTRTVSLTIKDVSHYPHIDATKEVFDILEKAKD